VIVSVLLLSLYGPCNGCPGQSVCFFQNEFRVLCLVCVLLQQIFLTGHGIGVLYVLEI
jgi:hypothetical protein